jgi:hypothetical protein
MARAKSSPVFGLSVPLAKAPFKFKYPSNKAGELPMVRIMLGTTPNLPCIALNNSFVFPVVSSGFRAIKRAIVFKFLFVVIDSTNVQTCATPHHGGCSSGHGQFSHLVLFNPYFYPT